MEERESKAKNLGARYAIIIEDDNKVLYIKEPVRENYKMFFALYDQDAAGAKESVLRTLVINEVSDMEVFDDYKSLLAAFSQLSEIMALKKSTLKTL